MSGFLKPFANLLGIGFHLMPEVAVDGFVLRRGIGSGTVETLLNNRKPLSTSVEMFKASMANKTIYIKLIIF